MEHTVSQLSTSSTLSTSSSSSISPSPTQTSISISSAPPCPRLRSKKDRKTIIFSPSHQAALAIAVADVAARSCQIQVQGPSQEILTIDYHELSRKLTLKPDGTISDSDSEDDEEVEVSPRSPPASRRSHAVYPILSASARAAVMIPNSLSLNSLTDENSAPAAIDRTVDAEPRPEESDSKQLSIEVKRFESKQQHEQQEPLPPQEQSTDVKSGDSHTTTQQKRSFALLQLSRMRKLRRHQSFSALSETEKRLIRREKIQQELISTEESYVQSLSQLVEYFVSPMRKMAVEGDLKADDVNQLFGNIELIFSFHRLFLLELAKPENANVDGFAMTFLRYSDYLKLYNTYINGYNNAVLICADLNANKKFKAFHQAALAIESPRLLDLESYLIQPIQRIPRYELLLSELRKYSEPDAELPPLVSSSIAPPSPLAPTGHLSVLPFDPSPHNTTAFSPFPSPSPSPSACTLGSPTACSTTPNGTLKSPFRGARRSGFKAANDIDAETMTTRLKMGILSPSPSFLRGGSTFIAANALGPRAHLDLALSKIKEIAVYVNESRRDEEPIKFTVLKLNRLHSNSLRVFELDTVKKTLTICKHKRERSMGTFARDMVIKSEAITNVQLSSKSCKRLLIWFFTSADRLLRSTKEWRVQFANSGERERFYRLMQVYLLRPTKHSVYCPKPLPFLPSVEQKLLLLPLMEVSASVHEAWVAQRQEQGWQLGPLASDVVHTHPLLVPFKDLPRCDRDQVIALTKETLAAIFALGFLIVSPDVSPPIDSPAPDPVLEMSTESLPSCETKISTTLDPNTSLQLAPAPDSSLIQLIEFLAENMHDCRAARRLADGWQFGEKLDLAAKRDPGLVAYCDLPSCEQDSDRASAEQVIVSLLELGYTFNKNPMPDSEEP